MLSFERIDAQMYVYACKIADTSPYSGLVPARHTDPPDNTRDAFEHMWFMCLQIREFIQNYDTGSVSERDKIMRWLGWLQAKLHTHNLYSLSELKSHNAPVGEKFRLDGGTPTSATISANDLAQ